WSRGYQLRAERGARKMCLPTSLRALAISVTNEETRTSPDQADSRRVRGQALLRGTPRKASNERGPHASSNDRRGRSHHHSSSFSATACIAHSLADPGSLGTSFAERVPRLVEPGLAERLEGVLEVVGGGLVAEKNTGNPGEAIVE